MDLAPGRALGWHVPTGDAHEREPTAESADPEATRARRRPRLAQLAVPAFGVAAVAAVAYRQHAWPAAARPGGTDLAVRAFALRQGDVGVLAHPVTTDTVAAVQVAGYGLVRSLVGDPGAVRGATEAMLVATVLGAALLFVLTRRLGIGIAGCVVGAALWLLPWAASAHQIAQPATIAMPWLLGGILLVANGIRRRTRLLGLVLLVIALATAPPVALVVVAGVLGLLLAGDAGSRWPTGVRWSLAGLLALLLVALAAATTLPAGGPGAPAPTVPDLAAVGLAGLTAMVALRRRWLLPVSVVFLALMAAGLAVAEVRLSAWTLALPAASVVLAAGADAAFRRLVPAEIHRAERYRGRRRGASGRPGFQPAQAFRPRLAVAVLVASAVLVAGLAVAVPWRPAAAASPDGLAAAATWVRTQAAPDTVLLADDPAWAELVRGGVETDRLASTTGLLRAGTADRAVGAALARTGAPTVLLVMAGTAPTGGWSATARSALRRSVALARFGSGDAAGQIRRVVADPAATRAAATRDRAGRRDVGTELAGNPNLALPPAARAALRAGDVDARLLVTLGTLSAHHTLDVAGFTGVAGENGPDREVRIRRLDGIPVTPAAAQTLLLRNWFTTQVGAYRPLSVRVDPDSSTVDITYPAPGPTGLVAS